MPISAERYVHEPLDTEVTAVAGHYVLTREERLEVGGRELLYVLGHAIFDTSCCGMGGCGYALVQPIRDPDERVALTDLIREREFISQVQFG
ncbi:MAG: hypothetical protein QGH45_07405 [Myxococcota bacterium]|jgi:hypothetical protein|nr:hypothetical protein [Myxococcota bacterium]